MLCSLVIKVLLQRSVYTLQFELNLAKLLYDTALRTSNASFQDFRALLETSLAVDHIFQLRLQGGENFRRQQIPNALPARGMQLFLLWYSSLLGSSFIVAWT